MIFLLTRRIIIIPATRGNHIPMPTTKKKTTAAAAKRTPKKSEGTRRFGIDTSFFKDIYQGDMPRFVIGIALLVSSI